ncbi:MAG: alpha/beta fold hydrolase, partial [Chloroflexia bacterium]|nr:alpha/beta fold hydrolase [Chloroflexia bacterium]
MRGRNPARPTPPEPDREWRRIEIGGAGIAYRVVGAGPPVVLVHGLAGSGRWWERNVGPLSARFQVFVVDLPGFGGNRVGAPFALVETPALLAAWLDRLGLGRVAVVGHSMGGRVAAELAADAPERVARLVLVAAAIIPAGPDWPVR